MSAKFPRGGGGGGAGPFLARSLTGADPGFLERGLICIKVWGFALLILCHFS